MLSAVIHFLSVRDPGHPTGWVCRIDARPLAGPWAMGLEAGVCRRVPDDRPTPPSRGTPLHSETERPQDRGGPHRPLHPGGAGPEILADGFVEALHTGRFYVMPNVGGHWKYLEDRWERIGNRHPSLGDKSPDVYLPN